MNDNLKIYSIRYGGKKPGFCTALSLDEAQEFTQYLAKVHERDYGIEVRPYRSIPKRPVLSRDFLLWLMNFIGPVE